MGSQKLLIVHGYSDGSTSFTALKHFFVEHADYSEEDVYFVDYTSMDDDTTYEDLADKLDTDYRRLFPGQRIDVVCHSTGALVVRAWLALHKERTRLRLEDGHEPAPCPVKRLVCLAPANFGSDLAVLGQSFLSKFRTTFFNSHSERQDAFETGKVLLQGLEPASPFQWRLSQIDLYGEELYFSPERPAARTCYPFVIAAGEAYGGLEARLIKQRRMPGTDGTVRIPGTSLNTRRCTLDFPDDTEPKLIWHPEQKFEKIPFAVTSGFNHGSIIDPTTPGFSDEHGPGTLALEALKVQSAADYAKAAKVFDGALESHYERAQGDARRCFQQFFFTVRDDVYMPVPDFYIDFFVERADGAPDRDLTLKFDEYLQATFSRHSVDASHRSMLVDCSELEKFDEALQRNNAKLMLQVNGVSSLPDVSYRTQTFEVYDPTKSYGTYFLCPNTTTLVDIVLNRQQSDRMIVLKDAALQPLELAATPTETTGGRAQLLGR